MRKRYSVAKRVAYDGVDLRKEKRRDTVYYKHFSAY